MPKRKSANGFELMAVAKILLGQILIAGCTSFFDWQLINACLESSKYLRSSVSVWPKAALQNQVFLII